MRRRWMTLIGILFISLALVPGTGLAAEKKPIKLGVVFIMSGKMGGYGKHGTQAIQLAMDEINGKGGILGRKVEAIFADDELKVDKGVQITNKFINEDKVDFIIGPTSSGVALAMADSVEKRKKILVLTQSATNSLTDTKDPACRDPRPPYRPAQRPPFLRRFRAPRRSALGRSPVPPSTGLDARTTPG